MTISLTLRGTKGTTLTYQEVDANFTNIRDAVDALTIDTSTFITTSSLATQLGAYVTTATNQTISGAKTLQNATLKAVNETVYAWGNVSAGTYSPNATSGTIQTMTLTGNVTINAFASPVAGQAVTLKITQDGTGSRTLTSTMKFAGGSKTLSTSSNAIDIVNIVYDGSDYLAALIKGFA
jgi:hypothetical protein